MEKYELRKYNEREYGIYDTEKEEFIQKGSLKVMQGALQDLRNGKTDPEKQFKEMINGFASSLKKENKEIKTESNWCGIDGIKHIWNGSWSDPQIEYNGNIYNEWDVQEYVGDAFNESEEGKNLEDGSKDWHTEFTKWCKENADWVKSMIEELTPDKKVNENKESKLESKLVESNGTDVAAEAIMKYTSDNGKTLDQEWLNNEIQLLIDNTRNLTDDLEHSKRPSHSIAYDGLLLAINEKVDGHGDLSSRQIQAGFKKLGLDFKEVIKPSVEYVEERRKELKEESEEPKTTQDKIDDFQDFLKSNSLANGYSQFVKSALKDKEKKTEEIEYWTQEMLDEIDDDYKTTVGETIRTAGLRGEDEEATRKLYKDLGYDESDPMVQVMTDKGSTLKPIKIKKENKEIKTESKNEYDREFLEYLLREVEINRDGEIIYLPDFEDAEMYKDLTEEEYNKSINYIKSLIEKADFYESDGELYIQLNDNHTFWEIDNENIDFEFIDDYLRPYFDAFEENTGVELWQAGRSGRHIVVKLTLDNLERYDELKQEQEKQEQAFIEEMNSYGKEEESKEVKTELYDPIESKLPDLAREVQEFMYNFDTYDYNDNYMDDEEAFEDAMQTLVHPVSRKQAIDKLKEIIEDDNEESVKNKAKELIDRINEFEKELAIYEENKSIKDEGFLTAPQKVIDDSKEKGLYSESTDNEYKTILNKINKATNVSDVNDVIMEVDNEDLRDELVHCATTTDVFDYNQNPQDELNSYKQELKNIIEDFVDELEENKKITEAEDEEDLGDISDPEHKHHNKDDEPKTTIDYLEDLIGNTTVGQLQTNLQGIFSNYNTLYIQPSDLYDLDWDIPQQIFIQDDDNEYVITYNIINALKEKIEVTDVNIY